MNLDLNTIFCGDALEWLRSLPERSVHCAVTSPPYFGLRDYGVRPSLWGGDANCRHDFGKAGRRRGGSAGVSSTLEGRSAVSQRDETRDVATGQLCNRCGAWRGCFGLEPTVQMAEICLKAGTSERGVCPECRAPWKRCVEKKDYGFADRTFRSPHCTGTAWNTNATGKTTLAKIIETSTSGWRPTCRCYDHHLAELPRTRSQRKREHQDRSGSWIERARRRSGNDKWETSPAIVLDPFMGAGTTGMVARRLGRDFVGCEIKPQYVAAAMRRIADRTSLPLFETAVEVKS